MRVQVILLDVRWFRSPLKPPTSAARPARSATCPTPIRPRPCWARRNGRGSPRELRKPAEVRLLVSSIQVLAEGHGWERWGNFPLERQKLFDTIRDSSANGRRAAVGRPPFRRALSRDAGRRLPALRDHLERPEHGLSGRCEGARPQSPGRALCRRRISASIDIDWWERNVTLALRDEGGTVRRSATIKADDLVLAPKACGLQGYAVSRP